MSAPEFVAVGHVTLDRFGDVVRVGGAALYAAIAAHRLGLSAGILTSHADDFPLETLPPQIEIVTVDAAQTTTFEHRRDGERRALRVVAAARPLGADHVPADWGDAPVVLLAPVLNEVDPLVAKAFGDASLGAAAQGWLRGLGPEGIVVPTTWAPPDFLLGSLQALFLSREDVGADVAGAVEVFQRVPMGALTAGDAGALLFVNGERYEVRPHPVREVDGTGAGDVFAAAFLIDYFRHADAWEAAAVAACAGALAVEGEGTTTIPDRAMVDAALRVYRQAE
ncbi:MAG TPA: PfkB family carbohydrate kinase [Methylomirabilota bacterium]|jgi:sugar/nucleoside kinase (ribokinase family)|nr:PfkB family carbohydrate kinase [Methylomirabilota bacterium]